MFFLLSNSDSFIAEKTADADKLTAAFTELIQDSGFFSAVDDAIIAPLSSSRLSLKKPVKSASI